MEKVEAIPAAVLQAILADGSRVVDRVGAATARTTPIEPEGMATFRQVWITRRGFLSDWVELGRMSEQGAAARETWITSFIAFIDEHGPAGLCLYIWEEPTTIVLYCAGRHAAMAVDLPLMVNDAV